MSEHKLEREPLIYSQELTKPAQDFELQDTNLLQIESARFEKLSSIKDKISLKHYQEIELKLHREQSLVEDLLNIKKRRSEHLAKYSLILDSHYFEQQLLT